MSWISDRTGDRPRGYERRPRSEELWDCLWLDRHEVRDLLDHTGRWAGIPPYLYPMACFAAYTGARRVGTLSEPDRRLAGSMTRRSRFGRRSETKEKTFTYRDVPIHHPRPVEAQHWFGKSPRVDSLPSAARTAKK